MVFNQVIFPEFIINNYPVVMFNLLEFATVGKERMRIDHYHTIINDGS